MEINWFTFAAQIINFLILLALLRRFLYGPVVRAVAQRQEMMAAEFGAATAKAEAEAASLRAQRQELEIHKEDLFDQAAVEASDRRPRMIKDARDEVEEMQNRWYTAVEQERALFLHGLRMRVGEQVARLTQRALADLAHIELEQAMVAVMLAQLERVTASAASTDGAVPGPNGAAVVCTAYPLPTHLQAQVARALSADTGGAAPRFMTDAGLICGIEIQLPHRRLAWNIRDYLQGLESELEEALATSSTPPALPVFEPEINNSGILPA
jgi:F-type H+-transporting ATPase subunit b